MLGGTKKNSYKKKGFSLLQSERMEMMVEELEEKRGVKIVAEKKFD